MVGKLLYIFERLQEPSTHASLAALFALFGQSIEPGTWQTLMNGGAVIFGMIGVFVKEGQPETVIKGF